MKYRALVSFCGEVNMATGEVKELDSKVAKQLLKAGYITEAEEKTRGKKNERNERKNS